MCTNRVCQVLCLVLAVFILYSTPGALCSKSDLKISTLNPGERLVFKCDQASFRGVSVIALDIWHMTTQGQTQRVASVTDGWVAVHIEGLDPNAVYGMQMGSLINMLTLDLPHVRPDQLGGYFCSVRYRFTGGEDEIVAVGGYINFFPTLD